MDFKVLSKYDDLCANLLLENLYLWFDTINMNGEYINITAYSKPLKNIIYDNVVVERDVKKAVSNVLMLPLFNKLMDTLNEKIINEFAQHVKRYLLMYMPSAGFEISDTTRYNGVQGCVISTKQWVIGDEVTKCTGMIACLKSRDYRQLIESGRDFSVMYSQRKNSNCLFLGPARFMNHDCESNCKFISLGPNAITFKVVKKIDIGEEMTVFYGSHYFGLNNRECRCASCERNGKGYYAQFVTKYEQEFEQKLKEESANNCRRSKRAKRKMDNGEYVYHIDRKTKLTTNPKTKSAATYKNKLFDNWKRNELNHRITQSDTPSPSSNSSPPSDSNSYLHSPASRTILPSTISKPLEDETNAEESTQSSATLITNNNNDNDNDNDNDNKMGFDLNEDGIEDDDEDDFDEFLPPIEYSQNEEDEVETPNEPIWIDQLFAAVKSGEFIPTWDESESVETEAVKTEEVKTEEVTDDENNIDDEVSQNSNEQYEKHSFYGSDFQIIDETEIYAMEYQLTESNNTTEEKQSKVNADKRNKKAEQETNTPSIERSNDLQIAKKNNTHHQKKKKTPKNKNNKQLRYEIFTPDNIDVLYVNHKNTILCHSSSKSNNTNNHKKTTKSTKIINSNTNVNEENIKQEPKGEERNGPVTIYDRMDLSTMLTLDTNKINNHEDKCHATLSSYYNNNTNDQNENINVMESEDDEIDIELVDNAYVSQLTISNDNDNNTRMEISKKGIDTDNIHSHHHNYNNGSNNNNNTNIQQNILLDTVDNRYSNNCSDISIHQSISQITLNSNKDDIIKDDLPENTDSKDDSDNTMITQLTNGQGDSNDYGQHDSINGKETYQTVPTGTECTKMDVEIAKVSLDNDYKGIGDKNQVCDPMTVDAGKKENDIDPYFDGNESDVSSTCSYEIRVLKKILRDDCMRCGRSLYPVPEQNYTRMKGTPEQYEELRQYARDHCWRCSRHFIIFELEWPLRRNKYFKLSVKNGNKK